VAISEPGVKPAESTHVLSQKIMSALPPIKWAQRADSLYVTIDVADIKDQNINLDGTHLTFRWAEAWFLCQ
jgi:HSP20 family molecular chaperone IbpA